MGVGDRLRAIDIACLENLSDRIKIEEYADIIEALYNALWEAVELSDRTLTPSARTAECQRVYDLCLYALKRAEGE